MQQLVQLLHLDLQANITKKDVNTKKNISFILKESRSRKLMLVALDINITVFYSLSY